MKQPERGSGSLALVPNTECCERPPALVPPRGGYATDQHTSFLDKTTRTVFGFSCEPGVGFGARRKQPCACTLVCKHWLLPTVATEL